MEQQYREMQAVVEELQGELAEQNERLAAYEQEGADAAHEHASVSWQGLLPAVLPAVLGKWLADCGRKH